MLLQRLTLLLALVSIVHAATFKIDGHVSHGLNTFNNKPLVDFTASSNIFSSLGLIPEIGVINPGGENASVITSSTPRRSLMATINATAFQAALGFPPGPGPFNIPIANTPTLSLASTSVTDRVKPKSFAASADPAVLGGPYMAKEADRRVTLGEWNKVSGRVTGRCRKGKAVVTVEIRNALPSALYTMWDIGVTGSLTKDEALSVGPFGGLPNVLATDKRGNAKLEREVNYCPFDKCPGKGRCTLDICLVLHFDNVVYGGAPELDLAGAVVGQVSSNHVQFFVNTKVLVPPQNKF